MIDLTPFAAFLVASTVGFALSGLTFLIARRSGLAPIQERLIDTLQDNAAALTVRVVQLERELEREQMARQALAATVRDLRDTVADLATENAALRRQLGMAER